MLCIILMWVVIIQIELTFNLSSLLPSAGVILATILTQVCHGLSWGKILHLR